MKEDQARRGRIEDLRQAGFALAGKRRA
jgi:hypothetical protein